MSQLEEARDYLREQLEEYGKASSTEALKLAILGMHTGLETAFRAYLERHEGLPADVREALRTPGGVSFPELVNLVGEHTLVLGRDPKRCALLVSLNKTRVDIAHPRKALSEEDITNDARRWAEVIVDAWPQLFPGTSALRVGGVRGEREPPRKTERRRRRETRKPRVFRPKTKAEYRKEKLKGFQNWRDAVEREGGGIIDTQGLSVPGVKPRHVFFMVSQPVRVPPALSPTNSRREELIMVKVSQAMFSEVIPSSDGPKGHLPLALPTLDAVASSVVKAQELLWQVESHEVANGLYWVPIIRRGKPCWLPLKKKEFNTWKGHLEETIKNFERHGLTYEKVKNYEEKQAFDEARSSWLEW